MRRANAPTTSMIAGRRESPFPGGARLAALLSAFALLGVLLCRPAVALELVCQSAVQEPPPTSRAVEALHLRFDATRGEISTLLRVREPDGTDAHHTEVAPCPALTGRAPAAESRRRNTLIPADAVARARLATAPERCFDPFGALYLLAPEPESDAQSYARDRPQAEVVLAARVAPAPPPSTPCAPFAANGQRPQPFAEPGRLQAFRLGTTSLLALVLLDAPAHVAVIDSAAGGEDCLKLGVAAGPHRLLVRREAALALRAATGALGLFALDAALDSICR